MRTCDHYGSVYSRRRTEQIWSTNRLYLLATLLSEAAVIIQEECMIGFRFLFIITYTKGACMGEIAHGQK